MEVNKRLQCHSKRVTIAFSNTLNVLVFSRADSQVRMLLVSLTTLGCFIWSTDKKKILINLGYDPLPIVSHGM